MPILTGSRNTTPTNEAKTIYNTCAEDMPQEESHREGKKKTKRVESETPPRSLGDQFDKTTLEGQADDVLQTAQSLLTSSETKRRAQKKEWDKLPLFYPGKRYTAEDAKDGFRVEDGYMTSHETNGDVSVAVLRKCPYIEGKTHAIVTKYADGGLAWMYWDYSYKNSDGHNLGQCAIKYGMGGWHQPLKDIRAKLIFTNESRSRAPGDCFVVAMDRPKAGGQVKHKQNEHNPDVKRIYRSNVPEDVQTTICLRDLMNIRQKLNCPTWWFM